MKKEGFLAEEATNTSVSHIQAQKLFIEGSMDGAQYKSRAFLIDGSYWYNESVDAKNFTTYDYLMEGVPREVRFMRLPVEIHGSVAEKPVMRMPTKRLSSITVSLTRISTRI